MRLSTIHVLVAQTFERGILRKLRYHCWKLYANESLCFNKHSVIFNMAYKPVYHFPFKKKIYVTGTAALW